MCLFIYLFIFICKLACMYLYTTCVPDALGDYSRALDPLEWSDRWFGAAVGVWELNLGPLSELEVLLPTE